MHYTIEDLHGFIQAPKPKKFTSHHLSIMLFLMTSPFDSLTFSIRTISSSTGMSKSQAQRSIDDCVKWKWIRKHSGKRRQDTNTLHIEYKNLPVYVPTHFEVGENAKKYAEYHKQCYERYCAVYVNGSGRTVKRKQLRADWMERWSVVYQKLLNEGYSITELSNRLKEVEADELNRGKLFAQGPQNTKLFSRKGSK